MLNLLLLLVLLTYFNRNLFIKCLLTLLSLRWGLFKAAFIILTFFVKRAEIAGRKLLLKLYKMLVLFLELGLQIRNLLNALLFGLLNCLSYLGSNNSATLGAFLVLQTFACLLVCLRLIIIMEDLYDFLSFNELALSYWLHTVLLSLFKPYLSC